MSTPKNPTTQGTPGRHAPVPGFWKRAEIGEELHPYAARVLSDMEARMPWEREFLQAVHEVFETITPVLERDQRFESEAILERLVDPERIIAFRVPWLDDRGQVHVNRGWRVQFNSALGPYKGGLRFHASVTLSVLKFLGFEQTFKNALTGLPMGGSKGGSDFNPRGGSEREIMRFCQSFMTELSRHIGDTVDVPAGDIGVGTREIGWMFGQYKRLTRNWNGTFTGKGLDWGGSLLRPEATGYGVVYFTQDMLKTLGQTFEGKRVAVSGFGNVAWGAVKKVGELGGKVVTLSGPDGYVYDPEGVTGAKIEHMLYLRATGQDRVEPYAQKFGVEFFPGQRPWSVPVDVALPCAIQNELGEKDAEALVANGCKIVTEGANMPTEPGAVRILQDGGVLFAPGKASNAGGVACSGFEMAQNRSGDRWSAKRVDESLHYTMSTIHDTCVNVSQRFDRKGDYVSGANIAGFLKVAEAMLDQGVV